MRLRRWFSLILLAAALLAGQQVAAVHPFSHYGEGAASQEDQQALEGAACDQCVAYAGFAGALPGAHGVPPVVAAGYPRLGTAPALSVTTEPRLTRARDPPFLL